MGCIRRRPHGGPTAPERGTLGARLAVLRPPRPPGDRAVMVISELARAKINLSLTVLGRRPDGYHELESLVTFADCVDRVSLTPGHECTVKAIGPFAAEIIGQNLLERALLALRGLDPELRLGRVELEKHLPVAAGLGGGSADAAALLRAVRRANPERTDTIPWRQVALSLGADVPMCLESVPQFVSGIGERSAAMHGLPVLEAILVNPRVPLATSEVFRGLGAAVGLPLSAPQGPPGPFPDLDGLLAFLAARGNDLEAAATRLLPIIAEIKSALAHLRGCRLAGMSGSGPTCFGLFARRTEALAGAALLATRWPGFYIVATTLGARGA